MLHDVFICHASEDKDAFVRPLAALLREQHVDVWYDEFSLNIGDSLRQTIDKGLVNSRFGIVVLSTHFFQKRWAQRELNGLVSREVAEDRRLILPIWHGINQTEIVQYSPPLADVFAISTDKGLKAVAGELLKVLRPENSPLIIARDFLISKRFDPPVVTDEWWLDIVEYKESALRFPDLNDGRRWIFPLPHRHEERGRQRGENIAWAALQSDWANEGETNGYCQITRPEVLHRYLRAWPGLMECARANPAVLAMYAPQLTIPGFDEGLEDVFDALLVPGCRQGYQMPGYGGGPDTIDDEPPLCGELIAWRHATFGNYEAGELADSFVTAYDSHYSRQLHNSFDCLIWLLSSDSSWLPLKIHDMLIRGNHDKTYGWSRDAMREDKNFGHALLKRSRKGFHFTRSIRLDLRELVQKSLKAINSQDSPDVIANAFIAAGFVDSYVAEEERIRKMRP